MATTSDTVVRAISESDAIRKIIPQWSYGMIAASIGISLLGAFTSTQLMCQARLSRYLSGVLLWSCLASLTFGFCSIWCLHFVAMLACGLDLPIGLNVPLTVLSAVLAVSFTFTALSSDLIYQRYHRAQRRKANRRGNLQRSSSGNEISGQSLVKPSQQLVRDRNLHIYEEEPPSNSVREQGSSKTQSSQDSTKTNGYVPSPTDPGASPSIKPHLLKPAQYSDTPTASPAVATPHAEDPESLPMPAYDEIDGSERNSLDASGASSEPLLSRRSSGATDSDASTFLGLGNIMSLRTYRKSSVQAKNAFAVMAKTLYLGCNWRNASKGLVWSFAIDSMHYLGIMALRIPDGYILLNPYMVFLSGMICWVVCSTACILTAQMETNLSQQCLFAVVATTGVAAMHFTGMTATTFYSSQDPSTTRGYPPQLAVAIITIAIITCLSANYLLAHSATVARNKLAEIVQTRKKLWAAIAQKENAEAAARARSDFIASASHEIRTPLHQLQGYGDLLSRTELTEEGRVLLYAIQHATRSLSLITSNVLDWSRLEKGEASCRPVALDIRLVCESIVNLLPNREDEVQAELMIVVAPTVPQSLFLDETYIQRILMNLLSNAIKFTSTGYVMLLVEMSGDSLVATVMDTGTGIPQSFLPDLFEPFKQAQTRGAQRGTGLGLSIIKQLLTKMQGTIDVTSKHRQADDDNGSTFVVKIPTQMGPLTQPVSPVAKPRQTVALFSISDERTSRGLRQAWQRYRFEVVEVNIVEDLPINATYVWTTLPYLKKNPEVTRQLAKRANTIILVPYDSLDTLAYVPELASPHFVTLQRPLVWHRIVQALDNAEMNRSKGIVDKAVRFAAEVNVVDEHGQVSQAEAEAECSRKLTILLVEDNKINQKLGVKMLKTLGYEVITADDGQEGVDKMLEHDNIIDAVLMDQSMPRKDGLTATTEIRAMEEDGTLSRRRPIIAVTAVVGPEAQAMCRDAGTDDFLPKPLSLAKLGQSLKHHLRSAT